MRATMARTAFPALMVLVVVLIGWEALTFVLKVPSYVLPSPSVLGESAYRHRALLVSDALVTLWESVIGFAAALVLAWPAGLLLHGVPFLRRALTPYLGIAQAVPLIAIAPILVLWLGPGTLSRVVMAALVAFFPLVISLLAGFRSVEADAVFLFRLLRTSTYDRYRLLLVPGAMPQFVTGMKTSLALSLVGALVAEFLVPTRGLGRTLVIASYQLDTPMLFAAVLMTALLAVLLLALATWIERHLVFWEYRRLPETGKPDRRP